MLVYLGGYITILSTPVFFPLNTAFAGFAEPQEKVSATLKRLII